MSLDRENLTALLYEALETEQGGVRIYEAALECVRDEKLEREWTKYLEQTMRHVEIVEDLLKTFDLDPDAEPPGRLIVRGIGENLVDAIESAGEGDDDAAAEIVAGECVVLAETKDHLNWKLLSECAKHLAGAEKKALAAACDKIEDEEDEHLYHSTGWTRELRLAALGIDAQLPPPEEKLDVRTAIGAARAEKGTERKRETASRK